MSKDSTSVDLGNNTYNVTQEQLDSFNLTKHLVDLLWNEPFYSRILRSLTKIESEDIPTAGVLATQNDITLWWNRSFLASLEKQHVRGVLKHECLHLIFGHTTERRQEPHLIWNYGTDLAINSIIPENELPRECLYPGRHLPKLTKEQEATMSESALKSYAELSIQISNFPPEKTSEFYFNALMKEGHLSNLDKEMDLSSGNGLGKHIIDSHDKWDELSQEEKDFANEKIKEILKDGVKEANKKGWGSVSASTRIELNKLISNEINWKSILKRFCGFTRKDERTNTLRRLNRKYPGIHPGVKKDNKPLIAIYVDESGSMSDTELEKLYAELQTLSSRTDFYLYKFDSRVDEKSELLWKKGKKLKVTRNLSGGTCFNAVTKHALKNKKKFDGYIIFTDGCAAKPKPSNGLKRAYMLLPNCSLTFAPDNSDIIINIK